MPSNRYSIYDLASAAGVTHHVVRHHIRRGFLPHAHGHAESAYYDDDHLHRLLAVQALRKVHKVALEDIGDVLRKADAKEIRRLAGIPEPVPPLPALTPGRELWQRFPVAPGVELHVRIDLASDVIPMVQAFEKAWGQARG